MCRIVHLLWDQRVCTSPLPLDALLRLALDAPPEEEEEEDEGRGRLTGTQSTGTCLKSNALQDTTQT